MIGNGFDLAHGLKTSYMDFLNYCKSNSNQFSENNFWLKYFWKAVELNAFNGKNWIDLEVEISKFISLLDKQTQDLDKLIRYYVKDMSTEFNNDLLHYLVHLKVSVNRKDSTLTSFEYCSFSEFRQVLFADLKRLTQALDLYLTSVVEKVALKEKDLFQTLNPDIVVNFNYTHTYQRLYGETAKLYHIHGECGLEENNMVLGIDDYWTDERKDTNTNYATFKKYIQRLQCKTYKTVIEMSKEISSHSFQQNEHGGYIYDAVLYFYGHSLAVTDKDILVKLLNNTLQKTVIYYRTTLDEGEYMSNLVVILGKEEFENRMMEGKLEFLKIPDELLGDSKEG